MKQYEIEVEHISVYRRKVWISAPNKRMAERFVRIVSLDNYSDDDPGVDELMSQVSHDEEGEGSFHEKVKVKTVASYNL